MEIILSFSVHFHSCFETQPSLTRGTMFPDNSLTCKAESTRRYPPPPHPQHHEKQTLPPPPLCSSEASSPTKIKSSLTFLAGSWHAIPKLSGDALGASLLAAAGSLATRLQFWRSTSIRGLSFCLLLASDTTLSFSLVFLARWSPWCSHEVHSTLPPLCRSVHARCCRIFDEFVQGSSSSNAVQDCINDNLRAAEAQPNVSNSNSIGWHFLPVQLCGGESDLAERNDLSCGGWRRRLAVAPSTAWSEPT